MVDEKLINELSLIIKDNFDKEFEFNNYKKIDFYQPVLHEDFANFIRGSRINVFIILKLLHQFAKDKSFYHGFLSVKKGDELLYDEEHSEEYYGNYFDKGVGIVLNEFTYSELFGKYLAKLGIGSFIIEDCIDLRDYEIKVEREKFNIAEEYQGQWKLEEKVYVAKDFSFIVSNEFFLVSDDTLYEKTLELFNSMKPFFDDFLEKHKNDVMLNHEYYVDWALKLFAGDVKVRTLPE